MPKMLSNEEIETLRSNPYIRSAHKSKVSFTADFKKEFLSRNNAGETSDEILRSFGIDPNVLGIGRVWSLAGMFRNELELHGGFSDVRRKSESDIQTATMEQLRTEVAYIKQEVEFLKKNIILDLGTQRKDSRKAARTLSLNSSDL